ncbi:MAG: hypothetical protein ACTIJA_00125 [Bavariicoccus seileri]|uniref:hypothetical protein n=1 Tax=Bavariicoccus seileri TaxID=549685 RepID=UPI0003B65EF7|nr:hypothetical protein [Bavariicoccus seileri]
MNETVKYWLVFIAVFVVIMVASVILKLAVGLITMIATVLILGFIGYQIYLAVKDKK